MEFPNPVAATSWDWQTANDAPARDPTKWTLEGSNNGDTWTVVDGSNANTAFATTPARFTWQGPFAIDGGDCAAGGGSTVGAVSNVRTHSTRCDDGAGYAAEALALATPYYCDRDYVMTSLPDFLAGETVIKTSNSDKRSDPNDPEWVCFDIDTDQTVYVLYDSRVEDGAEPAWLLAGFADQHVSVAEHTDTNMGQFEIWYANYPAGTVCTGGNNAPGIGSHYIIVSGTQMNHNDPNLVVLPPAVEGYSYVGCFVDSGNRDIAQASGVSLSEALFSDARVMQCANACDGYAYMGLQWTNECFCDNDYGGQGEVDITDCDSSGDVSDDAGAGDTGIADRCAVNNVGDCGWRNAVYEITYGAPGTGVPLVSNVQTKSTRCDNGAGYAPTELTVGTTMYCDRDYVFTTLPDFLDGAILITTSNSDKRSDPNDTEFLCFDLADEATVYLLYDSRAEDGSEPGWVTSMFVGQHLSVAEVTDTGMGTMEVWIYYADEPGTVCLGGNDAPGVGSNYLVAVGRATVHTQVVGSVVGYNYIGCYIDSSSRDVAVGMGGLSGDPADRVMECANRCSGYLYMGLQWDNECFCDNDYGDQGERDISSCDSDSSVGDFPDYADLAGVGNSARAGWTKRRLVPGTCKPTAPAPTCSRNGVGTPSAGR